MADSGEGVGGGGEELGLTVERRQAKSRVGAGKSCGGQWSGAGKNCG